ncbi:tlde1 domain-containing protein [Paraburkholderia sp. Cy-641]|uniref:tlde1 domain-containing protein n=1 Tax=Paraburkholderia sp. Cy-641 TaxID=2608337 RepID=UPI001F044BCB|nr:tlde1 domain-containing protein [Paraburkholderia sp. Cy-641]
MWRSSGYGGTIGRSSNHSAWFALYRNNVAIDDVTWINSVKRGQFRLHPADGQGVLLGCVTLHAIPIFCVSGAHFCIPLLCRPQFWVSCV